MRSLFFISCRSVILYALVILLNVEYTRAELVLPSIFSNNMVLQQKSNVPLWGKAKASSKVKITTSWNNKSYTVQSDEKGAWKALVETPSAGGPYQITLNDGKKLTLQNILIGEVWVCSGQSNMEMPLKGYKNEPVLNYHDILLNSDNSQIRLIRYEKTASRVPSYESKSTSWEVSNIQNAKEFSAVAYQFAQKLQQKLDVPVGIILSAWGGTRIEAWMPENSFRDFPQIKIPPVSDTLKISPQDPAVLFNGMITPFLGYGIKGVLWYQGESNRTNYEIYDKLMFSMVSEWRRLWKSGEFPFYYVQIAPYKYGDLIGTSSLLRESQWKASQLIPNSGMVVSLDVGTDYSIHPPDKSSISSRLAYWALGNTYKMEGLAYSSPQFKSMQINKEEINISFDHAENGLTSFGKPLLAFEVAGADKVFYPANAKITHTGITVSSDKVKAPQAVRYAFKDWVIGDVFNTEGLPLGSFRTDNW